MYIKNRFWRVVTVSDKIWRNMIKKAEGEMVLEKDLEKETKGEKENNRKKELNKMNKKELLEIVNEMGVDWIDETLTNKQLVEIINNNLK